MSVCYAKEPFHPLCYNEKRNSRVTAFQVSLVQATAVAFRTLVGERCNDREEARRSWGPADKEEGNRDFWASIQEPYNYIMGSNLIPDSYQVGETAEAPSSGEFELCWDSGDVSPPYVWSFSEFLDQYNELYEWLIQVQLKLYSHSNPPDKAARMAQQEELRRRTYRRKLFVEQGERVAQRYPGSSEEISWRVNYLNNKWDQLESNLTPAKGRNQEVEVELDLAHEEGILRRWLSDMEDQIQPLTCRLPRGSSLLTLQDRYKDNQFLAVRVAFLSPFSEFPEDEV
ncbi:hypothetical protein E2C01_016693 [Portunus trituberculatus]|uniref:Uncharacterized protein n=1 Tax=Portunus trituberculatus TaxID=210409 RepID=A0A5B7DRN1_PORTR|nr:hypothetical protein [Portunus trituberculatus]